MLYHWFILTLRLNHTFLFINFLLWFRVLEGITCACFFGLLFEFLNFFVSSRWMLQKQKENHKRKQSKKNARQMQTMTKRRQRQRQRSPSVDRQTVAAGRGVAKIQGVVAPKSGKTSQRCTTHHPPPNTPFPKMRSAPYIFLFSTSFFSFYFALLMLLLSFNFICTRST